MYKDTIYLGRQSRLLIKAVASLGIGAIIDNLKKAVPLKGGATRNGALLATTEYLYSQNYSKRVNGSLLTFTTNAA